MHHNFCFGQVHRLTSKAVPIQPFSSILDRFLLMKMSPKLKMMRLKWFFPYKLILGREIEWKWFHNSLAQFSHPFLIIGSSWPKRVRNWKWFDWSNFHHINQIWIEKSICKVMKLLRMNFCVRSWSTTFIHSWWSVPLDQKESETEHDVIDLIFSLWTWEKEVGVSIKIMKNTMVILAESYYPIQGYFWGRGPRNLGRCTFLRGWSR